MEAGHVMPDSSRSAKRTMAPTDANSHHARRNTRRWVKRASLAILLFLAEAATGTGLSNDRTI